MAFQVAADHPQVAGFGYLVANLATLRTIQIFAFGFALGRSAGSLEL